MIDLHRRGLITGLGAIICAPAIVRASSLMPVKPYDDLIIPYQQVSVIQVIQEGKVVGHYIMDSVLHGPAIYPKVLHWVRGEAMIDSLVPQLAGGR